MSRLDELPPDQRAALSLVLRKSYAEVAAMLGIGERAVHDRAHAALAVLAPQQARELPPERRQEVGDYLLGQQPGLAERLRTRTYLGASDPARAWALALTAELAPLAASPLPEVPSAASAAGGQVPAAAASTPAAGGGGAAAAPVAASAAPADPGAPPSSALPPRPAPSSRVGGALLLAVLVAGVVVAIVLLTKGGSKGHGGGATAGATTATQATSTTPVVNARVAMRSPSSAGHGLGLLEIASEGSKRAFLLVAEKLPPTSGFFYALWLYNRPGSQEPLGKAPAVSSSGVLQGGGALPANASEYHQVLLTRETSTTATHPGPVVLRGSFTLSG